jgi:hypothetical protein
MPVMPGAIPDVDPFFRRMTWSAVLFCLGAAGLALLVTGNWRVAAGVIGGGLLVGISLMAIRSSVDTMIAVMTAGDPEVKAQARRRGLLIGASSLVASAALEAGRVLTRMRT